MTMATNTDRSSGEQHDKKEQQHQQHQHQQFVVSLSDPSSSSSSLSSSSFSTFSTTSPARVGGKASSLAKLFSIQGLSSSSSSSSSNSHSNNATIVSRCVVPKAYALTVDFFQPWIDELKKGTAFPELVRVLVSLQTQSVDDTAAATANATDAIRLCTQLQEECQTVLVLSQEQSAAIQFLVDEMNRNSSSDDNSDSAAPNPNRNNKMPMLLAVRSSAPEEDGTGASFAGAFDTKLGIPSQFPALEQAIRACFASLWDYRVFHYKQLHCHNTSTTNNTDNNSTITLSSASFLYHIGFAVVVMEMIDSNIAGVAFTANPLNSDRDECVIDSSWGLGESVVDGSVIADKYVVNKIDLSIVEETIGIKGSEKRLDSDGGVIEHSIDGNDPRCSQLSTLTKEQIMTLTKLVTLVENAYGVPMDVEWAIIFGNTNDTSDKTNTNNNNLTNNNDWELKLLQARPITTLYSIDEFMMTQPTEKRKLYFDMNIMSGGTTTNPFTRLDFDYISNFPNYIFEIPVEKMPLIGTSSDSFRFNASTRQYINISYAFKVKTTAQLADNSKMIDAYLSSIFASTDCSDTKYRATSFPSGWLSFLGTKLPFLYKVFFTSFGAKYQDNPQQMKIYQRSIVQQDMSKLMQVSTQRRRRRRLDFSSLSADSKSKMGRDSTRSTSLEEYVIMVASSIRPSLKEELECNVSCVIPTFKMLNEKRNDPTLSQEVRNEYEALCGGYIGDELMEMNIAMYQLANALDESIWKKYDSMGGNNNNEGMVQLVEVIQKNLRVLELDDDDGTTTTSGTTPPPPTAATTASSSGGGYGDGDDDFERLPLPFVRLWKVFLEEYGFDGQDQLFVSCPRYADRPDLLLVQLKSNALGQVKDPARTQQEQVAKRRAVMKKHEAAAEQAAAATSSSSWYSWFSSYFSGSWSSSTKDEGKQHFGSLLEVQKRNEILEHLMWVRNAPKIHLTKCIGIIRKEVLLIQDQFMKDGLLEEKGDIFHLSMKEIDDALTRTRTHPQQPQNQELMDLVRPRKIVYERAVQATTTTECPILVDSRNRILRPDPPTFYGPDGTEQPPPPGTLVGAAMSPGVVTGRVRIIHQPQETFHNGEILCAVVTGPAWTPLFATAAGVILQIGGVLQHGALCAREYGKPAVSNIDIHALLQDGMLVSVDGNQGIVKILEE